MNKILLVGAGITGGYTAARLHESGAEVTLLARGVRGERVQRDGLRLRDGLTGMERTVYLPVALDEAETTYDLVMVCVQDQHRHAVELLVNRLPGRPIVWFLGNTTHGYERAGVLLGRERIIGGFPFVGGMWDGDVLVYADRMRPENRPFDRLVAGEAFPEAAPACAQALQCMDRFGLRIFRYVPIMAWHLCHAALILPLAGVFYAHDGNLESAAADVVLLERAMRAVRQGLTAVRAKDRPILPRSLHILRYLPAALGARKIARTLTSDFGRIALAGHAHTAREEMRFLAQGFLDTLGSEPGGNFLELIDAIPGP